ncbi:uncharacterized protein LOC120124123 isoform X2 [Hibiscus syriacus]|uniref:uncharacterized protein LOC120124123 isoform X2 n=1 Tax=Hibiscus syriacus TaxID=106335 RepID=UPI0019232C18|nr:uncharacterized protein LOC120124123 isoform X2 [Hibiscus syriacus]
MVDPLPVGCNREAGSSVFGGPLGTAIDGGSIGSGSGLREGGLAGLGSLTAFPAPNSEVGRLDLGGLGDFPSLGTAVEGGAAALSGTGSGLREGGVVSLEAGLGSPKASPAPGSWNIQQKVIVFEERK